MRLMVVTLEVSQLEMSALKFLLPAKSQPMSVMAETSQSAMGPPYVAVAAVGLALNARSAVCREALVANVPGGDSGGEGGEGDGGGDGGGLGGEGGGDGTPPKTFSAISVAPLRSVVARMAPVKWMVPA